MQSLLPHSAPRIVVVGVSLGGVEATQVLAAGLPRDFAAPIVIVLHIGSHRSVMPRILSARGPLPARHVSDGEELQPGHIYVAPSDQHVLVEGPRLRLSKGPKEHHTRPAIDPLFRSAALAHGPHVVGVVMTGLLDDGTAGLQAVKACGGVAVVQDPDDAFEPSMPLSALRHAKVDHCVPLADIPALLTHLVAEDVVPPVPTTMPPLRERHEHDLFLLKGTAMEHLNQIATPSTFVCPDCHGALWELKDTSPTRYRCHTGHAFTLRTLEHAQASGTDQALWGAIRALQEKQLLLERRALELAGEDAAMSRKAKTDACELASQAAALRTLLQDVPTPLE